MTPAIQNNGIKNGNIPNREKGGHIREKASHLQITAMTKASAKPVPIIIVTLFLRCGRNRDMCEISDLESHRSACDKSEQKDDLVAYQIREKFPRSSRTSNERSLRARLQSRGF